MVTRDVTGGRRAAGTLSLPGAVFGPFLVAEAWKQRVTPSADASWTPRSPRCLGSPCPIPGDDGGWAPDIQRFARGLRARGWPASLSGQQSHHCPTPTQGCDHPTSLMAWGGSHLVALTGLRLEAISSTAIQQPCRLPPVARRPSPVARRHRLSFVACACSIRRDGDARWWGSIDELAPLDSLLSSHFVHAKASWTVPAQMDESKGAKGGAVMHQAGRRSGTEAMDGYSGDKGVWRDQGGRNASSECQVLGGRVERHTDA
ncbi:hypothetical protein EDB80DRAFT_281277 [Ilyonectria destructans]|nr:hypothetical protein EDB80DRAFT_281277 [Ilyonectria destructans]